jgi:hypothetical protein
VSHLLAAEARLMGSLVVGMALGIWWEGYRGLLRGLRPRGGWLTVLDLTFWAVAFGVTAFGLYWANWLDLRLYAVAAALGGAVLAHLGAGPVVRPAVAAAAGGARRALGRVAAWLRQSPGRRIRGGVE